MATDIAFDPRLLPVPVRLAPRPRERGYLVPWFVAEAEQPDGTKRYDFRVIGAGKIGAAVQEQRCWLCGQPMGRWLTFVVGPMCALNQISSEPPSHRECAEYAARASPFLTQREVRRRTHDLPQGTRDPAGIMIDRQPGVALLWTTRRYRIVRPPDGGVLFRMGDPTTVAWLREGRPATRAEVEASIDTGYPLLLAEAERDGPEAIAELAARRLAVTALLPATEESAHGQ